MQPQNDEDSPESPRPAHENFIHEDLTRAHYRAPSRVVRRVVNAIAPGPTKTNIQSGLMSGPDGWASMSMQERLRTAIKLIRTAIRTVWSDFDTSAMRDVPMDRIAEPEEMAGAVAFLCSSDASYITGHTLPIDGGQAAD